jgi:hypothetical protein
MICDECLLVSAADWICFPEIIYFSPCIAGRLEAFQVRSLLYSGSFEDDFTGDVQKCCIVFCEFKSAKLESGSDFSF